MHATRRQLLASIPALCMGGVALTGSSASGQSPSDDELNQLAEQLRRAVSTRPRLDVTPEIFTLPTASIEATTTPQLGTVTILFGKQTNENWSTTYGALQGKDYDGALSTLQGIISEQNRTRQSGDLSVSSLESIPVLADIYFQGRPIIESMPILNDTSISGLTLPYNGAVIRPEDFEVRLYSNQNCLAMTPPPEWCSPIIAKGGGQRPVLLVQPPPLTPLEEELFKSLEGQVEFPSLGDPDSVYGYATTLIAVAYVVAIVYIATTGGAEIKPSDIPYEGLPPDLRGKLLTWADLDPATEYGSVMAPHLAPEAIAEQPPLLSARELLDVRSELMRYAIGAVRN